MSLSYASRHTRRVPGSTSCVRRCVGVARAAREGLPPLGDGLRTPRRASKRASSATKAPQRSPRGTRPSSPPPRPGGTRTERRRTRPQPLQAARALDAARDLFVRGFRPMKTQLLLDSTPPRRVQTRSQPQILGQDPRQLPPPSRNPKLLGYRRRGSRNSFSVTPPCEDRARSRRLAAGNWSSSCLGLNSGSRGEIGEIGRIAASDVYRSGLANRVDFDGPGGLVALSAILAFNLEVVIARS